MKLLALLTILTISTLTATPVKAEFYEYTDNEGVVHFVDNISSIPKKYQKQKKTRVDDQSQNYSNSNPDDDFIKSLSFKEVEQRAKAGESKAQCWLGYMYRDGMDGVKIDESETIKWQTKAANNGSPGCQFQTGFRYFHGKGVEKNLAKAQQYLEASAAQGNSDAQTELGDLFCYKGNNSEGVEWYKKGAANGNSLAMYTLGQLYEKGTGVKRDLNEAQKWYRKAKEAGYGG
jgi:TPR repeat protein